MTTPNPISIATPDFLAVLSRYCTDGLMGSELEKTARTFCELTQAKSLDGISYTVQCLIIAQAMEDLMAGYAGRSTTDRKYLHEAVGYQMAVAVYDLRGIHPRYKDLVTCVNHLQQTQPKFVSILNKLQEQFK